MQATDIRQRRKQLGLSQEAVARQANCSTAYVRLIEGGYRPRSGVGGPTYDRVLAVLDDAERTTA